jgi:hypothetical protein
VIVAMADFVTLMARALTVLLALQFLLSKAFFLHGTRLGWWMVFANTLCETLEKRAKVRLPLLDGVLLSVTIFFASYGFGPWVALSLGMALSLSWSAALLVDLRWRSDDPAFQCSRWPKVPLPIPRLAFIVRGPIVSRGRRVYELGDWPVGMEQEFELIILNPTIVSPQLPLEVSCESSTIGLVVQELSAAPDAPLPGAVARFRFRIHPTIPLPRGGTVLLEVSNGGRCWRRELLLASAFSPDQRTVAQVRVLRWKYGCNAAFAWRGDHDLYDPSTFQSEKGLRLALGLARRFRMPTTVMLSSRLSLDEQAHAQFCRHHGWDRKSSQIPGFVDFLRDQIDMTNEQEFPTDDNKPFSAEIGNHMHLHYGTHASADPGNGWRANVRSGAGSYPWMRRCPCSSFEEQRDNMLACAAEIRRNLGVETSCFAIPSDFYDRDTSRAAEAAGIEVGNDTDSSKLQRQLFFPAEHHPEGCDRFVELTRMSPRDPSSAAHVAMLKYWVSVARRKRRAMVFLAHHHLLLYRGWACFSLTAELLRYVVADTDGDVHCATITSLGRYWRDVLSARTRCWELEQVDGRAFLTNRGPRPLLAIPAEVEFSGGGRMIQLVNLPPNQRIEVGCGFAPQDSQK